MSKNTAPAPETTEAGPVEHTNPRHPAPHVVAGVDESALGDLVTLYTDWDGEGTSFPVEYLPQVIASLQAVQNKLRA